MALEFYVGISVPASGRYSYCTLRSLRADGPEDDVLLAILLLCVHEAHNFSDPSRMFPHLNAAAVILRQRLCFAPPNPELRTFLLEIFCYFFALVAFSHGSSLDIAPVARVFESISVNGGDSRSQSLLLGPSQDLIATIFCVSMLMHSPNKLTDDERRLELTHIELQLQNLDTNCPATNQGDLSHDDLALFELYRLACLVYVR
ncbi:hypothetical protein SI65_06247 [Aspergillus cristatus]|uniref:Transcription factor domain-containing protein n=1 Tax=Aspergillus cristatus TaxID=573508 RepID=A0A1E3BDA8_ASPCR|nr:hypothetical protein SI65_06247 [Aspergillus cristatus]